MREISKPSWEGEEGTEIWKIHSYFIEEKYMGGMNNGGKSVFLFVILLTIILTFK